MSQQRRKCSLTFARWIVVRRMSWRTDASTSPKGSSLFVKSTTFFATFLLVLSIKKNSVMAIQQRTSQVFWKGEKKEDIRQAVLPRAQHCLHHPKCIIQWVLPSSSRPMYLTPNFFLKVFCTKHKMLLDKEKETFQFATHA